MIGDLTGLAAVLAPFVMVVLIVKMKHDRRLSELNLQTVGAGDQKALQEMTEIARRLEGRIVNLERILDTELAGWRNKMSA